MGRRPQVHLECCRQKGGADEGQSLPLLALDRSRTRLLRNLLDNALARATLPANPCRCAAHRQCWPGLMVEAVLPGAAF